MRTLRTCEVYTDQTSAVFVVESVESRSGKTMGFLQAYGTVRPLFVIVCAANDISAYDTDAKPADVQKLSEVVPELDSTISAWRRTKQSD